MTDQSTDPATWQEVQAAKPDPIDEALSAWREADGRTDRIRMIDAIDAYELALETVRRCDEPGCQMEASCGWPVVPEGGYRRTCYAHSKWRQ